MLRTWLKKHWLPLLLLAVAAPLVTLCFPRAKSPVEDGKEAAQ